MRSVRAARQSVLMCVVPEFEQSIRIGTSFLVIKRVNPLCAVVLNMTVRIYSGFWAILTLAR